MSLCGERERKLKALATRHLSVLLGNKVNVIIADIFDHSKDQIASSEMLT